MSNIAGATTLRGKLTAILTDPDGRPRQRAPLATRLKYALAIRRVEFLPVHTMIGLVPAAMAAQSWSEFLSLSALVAVLFAITHMELADMINALADREVDAAHKSPLPEAIYGLGVSRVLAHIAVTTVAYFGMAVFLAARSEHWDLVLIAFAAWLMGVAYSFPPLHLKSAGIWQLPTLQILCVFLPGLVVLRSFEHDLEWASVGVVAGLSLTLTAMFVTNHAEDYWEDEQFGIRTYVIALGLTRAIDVQSAMLFLGALLTVGSVWLEYGFTWGLIPYILVWLASQRFMFVLSREVRAPMDAAIAAVRRKAITGPYHGVVLGLMTVVLAFFVLSGR
jgi:1,4-dihydroxy-2-naphthoate octaprenyltransferase